MKLIRFFPLIVLLFLGATSLSQLINDTLYFKSGQVRPCQIDFFDFKNIHYTYFNSKGVASEQEIKVKSLKYFVVYDSLNVLTLDSRKTENLKETIEADTALFMQIPDSIEIRTHLLSVNPLSVPLLSMNLSYTYRFGENKKFGLHIPFRSISPILYQTFAFYTGVGMTFFIADNPKFSMTMDVTPSFYYLEFEDWFVSIPCSIGFVRYYTSRLGVTGSIGLGPGFNSNGLFAIPLPAAHIGLTFMLGPKARISTDRQR